MINYERKALCDQRSSCTGFCVPAQVSVYSMWCTVRFFGANGQAYDVLESNIRTSIQSLEGPNDAILSVHAFDRDKLKTVRLRDGIRRRGGATLTKCAST